MGYTIRWVQNENNREAYHTIPTTGTIFEEETPNSQWNTAVSYAGTSVASVSDAGGVNWNNDYKTGNYIGYNLGKTNFRMATCFYTSAVYPDRYGFKYTGLNAYQSNYYQSTESNVSLINPLLNNSQNVPTTGSGSVNHPYLTFISSINVNDLILIPRFVIGTLRLYNYRGGENSQDFIDGIGNYYANYSFSDRQAFTWSEVKNEDNTSEGSSYDRELFENGYKVISSDSDSITYQVVIGVGIEVLYGKSSNTYDETTDSYTTITPQPETVYGNRNSIDSRISETPVVFNNVSRSRTNFMIINEGYYNNSIYYYNTAGIRWGVTSAYELTVWQVGEFACSNAEKLSSTSWNTVNSYYGNNTYGGIVIENSVEDAYPTGNVISTGLPALQASFTDNTNSDYGNTSTNTFRYINNLSTGNNPILIGYRKGFNQYNAFGCYFSIKELWQKIACYGLYVADSLLSAQKAQLGQNVGNNNHIYLGEMLSDGTTTGRMLQGSEIADSVQAGIEDIIAGTPYTPITPGPQPSGDDPTNPPTPSGKSDPKITGDTTKGIKSRDLGAGSISYYALSVAKSEEFKTLLWAQTKTFYNAIQIAGKQNNSIFDYISSFRYYPTSLSSMGFVTSSASSIYLGTGAVFKKADTTDFTLPIINSFITQFDWCRWSLSSFSGWRNNFLDYSPYCKMSIYLPYAGTFDLDMQTVAAMTDITQATIKVSVVIDANTGSLSYFVDADGCLILEKTTKFGIDFPISGNDVIQQSVAILQSNYHNGSEIIGEASSIAGSVASNNAFDILSSAAQLPFKIGSMSLASSLASRQVPTQVGSFGGSVSSITQGQDPYITIYRQKIANPDNYGHAVGYLTDSAHTISDLSGWTICKNPDLSGIAATSAELDMIRTLLTTGFYA